MSFKNLKIIWNDGYQVELVLRNNPIAEFYYSCIKHLQHVDLYFGPRENPYHPLLQDRNACEQRLKDLFFEHGVSVDVNAMCEQQYLNLLHDRYFDLCAIRNDPESYGQLMLIHDMIHVMEMHNKGFDPGLLGLMFNYRAKAGMLYKPFRPEYMQWAEYSITAGTAYLREVELGKNPLVYYNDKEAGDVERICRIVKPWVNLIPSMILNFENRSESTNFKYENQDFVAWFKPFRETWTAHYNIPDWHPKHIKACIPIGDVAQYQEVLERVKDDNYPIRICI